MDIRVTMLQSPGVLLDGTRVTFLYKKVEALLYYMLVNKTAQRIIIDLKDKIVSLGIADELPANGGNVVMVNNGVKDEAVSALTMLGFSPAPSASLPVMIGVWA